MPSAPSLLTAPPCAPLPPPPPYTDPPPGSRTSPCIVCPRFDSAGREGVQPAAELRHVQRHKHESHVLRAYPGPQSAFRRSRPVHATCAVATPTPSPTSPARIVCPFRLDRAQTPCPTPTSCSAVARGRAIRPSPLSGTLKGEAAMARVGLREAAQVAEMA